MSLPPLTALRCFTHTHTHTHTHTNGCSLTIVVRTHPVFSVELMGGTGIARDVVFSALQQGTHVVTANKALVAGAMPELESLLEKRSFDVGFGYEAAVAGGIPIIRSLQQSFAMSDRVHRVAGIMNGTTNYMLTKMDSEGANYGEVLREAQAAGL